MTTEIDIIDKQRRYEDLTMVESESEIQPKDFESVKYDPFSY